jgi:hypothetical protein
VAVGLATGRRQKGREADRQRAELAELVAAKTVELNAAMQSIRDRDQRILDAAFAADHGWPLSKSVALPPIKWAVMREAQESWRAN